jgi:hypothetical protein
MLLYVRKKLPGTFLLKLLCHCSEYRPDTLAICCVLG